MLKEKKSLFLQKAMIMVHFQEVREAAQERREEGAGEESSEKARQTSTRKHLKKSKGSNLLLLFSK